MTRAQAHKRILILRKTIEHHRYLYHVRDIQEISDAALDSLKHELYTLESQYPEYIVSTSPTQRVGGKALDTFEKVMHTYPMLSMEDVFSEKEFSEWETRIKKLIPQKKIERPLQNSFPVSSDDLSGENREQTSRNTGVFREVFHGLQTKGRGNEPEEIHNGILQRSLDYYAEVKMDGLALSLLYADGELSVGATRGDGKVGENVTQNIKTIEAIPLALRIPSHEDVTQFIKKHRGTIHAHICEKRLQSLQGTIEVRGEVFMMKRIFDQLNEEQEKKGEHRFANPRNAAAGSIRQLDPAVTASRRLDFFGYALMNEEEFGITTHQQAHEILSLLGIKINRHDAYCASSADVIRFHEHVYKTRTRLPYWTDGIVVGVNDNALFKKLGVVGKTPRGTVAFKFPAEQVTTVLREVHFQVGRTGALTPVGTFDPVVVAGTTVTHATLHNIDEINRLDVRIGDTVIIEKAGDIIPKVIRVLKEMRSGSEKKIKSPHRCPVCESPIIRKEGEVALYCSNKACFAKEKERIIHFVSRKAFDIDGLGEKIVEQLINEGLIHDAADLFTLMQGDLESLERFAETSARNLIEAIDARRSIELPRFLYALGIRHVGEETAFDLARNFGTLDRIAEVSVEECEGVPNIGTIVARSVVGFFSDEKNKQFLTRLRTNGVTVLSFKKKVESPFFANKTFVLTGTLVGLTRESAQKTIRDLGGVASSSVSKETDYVIVGENPGSKYEKAKKLGVHILSEEEFLQMIPH